MKIQTTQIDREMAKELALKWSAPKTAAGVPSKRVDLSSDDTEKSYYSILASLTAARALGTQADILNMISLSGNKEFVVFTWQGHRTVVRFSHHKKAHLILAPQYDLNRPIEDLHILATGKRDDAMDFKYIFKDHALQVMEQANFGHGEVRVVNQAYMGDLSELVNRKAV